MTAGSSAIDPNRSSVRRSRAWGAVVLGICLVLIGCDVGPRIAASIEDGRGQASRYAERADAGAEFYDRMKEMGADDRELEFILDEAREAQARSVYVAAEVDTEMRLGRSYEARLIAERESRHAIVQLTEATPEPTVFTTEVLAAPKMTANLTSASFVIEATSDPVQVVRPGAPAVWTWTITPRQSGRAVLMFHLQHDIELGTRTETVSVDHFPRGVEVTVSPWSSVKAWFKGLGASTMAIVTILSGLAGIGSFLYAIKPWRRWRRRQQAVAEETAQPQAEAPPKTAAKPERPKKAR